MGKLESGYDWHACDCNYLVSIGQASEKQASHNLNNRFSGISFMGSTIIDSIDDIHKFVRNKMLEIDAREKFITTSKSQFKPKEWKTGTSKS